MKDEDIDFSDIPEIWNRLGTKILPKLRAGADLKIGLEFSVAVSSDTAQGHSFRAGGQLSGPRSTRDSTSASA